MSAARAWVAQADDAETVAALLVEFRDHNGRDWPSDNAFLASVERLVEDRDTEFLLASPDDDSAPAGVLQLRFRFSVWRAAPDAWLEDRDAEFLLASRDDDSPPEGVLQLRFRFSVWTAAPDAWLEDLFVREGARGAGVGHALLDLAIERAAERGAKRIELDTEEDNDVALALYRQNGFSERSKGERGRSLFLGRPID